jgi:salicylate hydroxylase
MNLDPYTQDKYGLPYLVIHRADLRKILYEEAVAQGADVRFGVHIDSQTSDLPNGVIRFTEPQEMIADLVIGADGPQSICRAALVQKPHHQRPTGITVVRIVVPITAIRDSDLYHLVEPPCVHTWLGPRSLAICYTLHDAFNIVVTRPATEDEVFIGPRPENVERLRSFFKDWDPQMRKLLDVADDFQKWSLLEVDEPPTSFVHESGKLVLAGDSAHSVLPYL